MGPSDREPQRETRPKSLRPLAALLFIATICFAYLSMGGVKTSFPTMHTELELILPLPHLFLATLLMMTIMAMWRWKKKEIIIWLGCLVLFYFFYCPVSMVDILHNIIDLDDPIFHSDLPMTYVFLPLILGLLGMVMYLWNKNEGPLLYSFFTVGALLSVLSYSLAFRTLNGAVSDIPFFDTVPLTLVNLYCGGVTLILFVYCWIGSSLKRSGIPEMHRPVSRHVKTVFSVLALTSVLNCILPLLVKMAETAGTAPRMAMFLPWVAGVLACLLQVGAAVAGACWARGNPLRALFAGFLACGNLFCSVLISTGLLNLYLVSLPGWDGGPIHFADLPAVAAALHTHQFGQLLLKCAVSLAALVSVVSLPVLFVQLHPHGIGETPATGPCGAEGSGES